MSTNHSSPESDTDLRLLVDIVWNHATESTAVPSTKTADMLIAKYRQCFPAPAQCAPEELAREELAIARLRAVITGEEFEWEIDGGSPFDDVQFLLRAYDRLAPSTVTSTMQQPVENKVWPTGTGNTPQDVQLTSLVSRPESETP